MKKQLDRDINKSVFVVWSPFTPRAAAFAQRMNSKLYFVNHLIKNRGVIWKFFHWIDYAYKAMRTIVFLIVNNPKIVFAQSPPSFCPMVCYLYCFVLKRKLVIDCHDSTFKSMWFFVPFFKKTLASSNVVIVHNNELAKYVNENNKYPVFVLNDKLKDLQALKLDQNKCNNKYFLVIFIYDNDEPVGEVLEAIKQLQNENEVEYVFKLTGNYLKREDLYWKYKNVKGVEFLGFVPRKNYEFLLGNAFGVIALSNQNMKQSCAIAESVGAKVPLIASDTETNRRLLCDGATFTSVDVQSIKVSIHEFIENRSVLMEGIKSVRKNWEIKWENDFSKLLAIINNQ